MKSVEPLHAVADALGIGEGQLVEAETVSRLAGTFSASGTDVARLTGELLDGLSSAYADAVRLTVKIGDLDEFSFNGDFSASDLAKLVGEAPTTPSYDIVLQIDKEALLRRIDVGEAQAVLYLHGRALLSAFRRGLSSIEQDMWSDRTRRLVVLVFDRDISVTGDMLSIFGGEHMTHATAEVAAATRHTPDLARVSQRRNEYIGWDSELSTALTPWHFAYNDAKGDSSIVAQVDAAFVLLAVLFTCDRARAITRPAGPPRVQAEFRGREHVAFVPIDQSEPLNQVSPTQRAAVRELLDWCYQTQASGEGELDWLADRLPFVQSRVAQALEGRSEPNRFQVYATAMPEILEGAKWHWRAFLEGRVSDYLDRVQKLESTISDAVDSYAERTTALVKSLSETILAAVAVLIGSFIAATFNEPFAATLFRIGVVTYAAYVLLFPGLLGLLVERGHANQIDSSFGAQRTRFEDVLYPDKVEEIVGARVSGARTRFNRWWIATAVCFVFVATAAVIAAVVVPDHADQTVAETSGVEPASTTTP